MEKKAPNFARRDRLVEIEQAMQKEWSNTQPNYATADPTRKKFYVTFPYCYMNGKLHLGHAFSMSKSEIQARFRRLEGENVLFPQAFHCTGMPIQAAANKLKKELEEGWVSDKGGMKQSEILLSMNIPEQDIALFKDSTHWLKYFPPIGQTDMQRMGVAVDWRRSFITTDHNPYYDSFIRWQFNHLKKADVIAFGKRPTIINPSDGQICMDHDRSEGEGVNPQEYTLIKLQVLPTSQNKDRLQDGVLKTLLQENKIVHLVAATLRPETMYGQTNCYILPGGDYGLFQMKGGEVFVSSLRAAQNMSHQGLTEEEGKINQLGSISGDQLIGLALKAPLSPFEQVYSLPMMTISMNKGTGIVTSVPSDSPDDFAALRDLQNKAPLREKFGLTEDMVAPFQPVEIVEIPGYSKLSGVTACEEFKVKSQNDKAQLIQAKDKVYLKGFYDGVMLVGSQKGKKVQEAKPFVKEELIKNGQAASYHEPDGLVVSRSGENCVVGFVDQWFLNYLDENWKQKVREHVKDSSLFHAYADNVQRAVESTVEWLREWGCFRSAGLGTRLPWDQQFIIESLSDSTIYFAYYTVAHMLQSDLEGKQPGLLNIQPNQMTDAEWDAVLLGDDASIDSLLVPKDDLLKMRNEFEYWYPMDLRCSAKDLIKNHLTMSLFNHAAIFKKEHMPRAFFCNGYINIDDQKMSKSTGNFLTMEQVVQAYGADATRVALATSGDTMDDSNFERNNADQAILKLSTMEMFFNEMLKSMPQMRSIKDESEPRLGFYDQVLLNQIRQAVHATREGYLKMRYRDSVKAAFFELVNQKEEYKLSTKNNMAREVVLEYMLYQVMLMHPITPHTSEYLYNQVVSPLIQKYGSLSQPSFDSAITLPNLGYQKILAEPIDHQVLRQNEMVRNLMRNARLTLDKLKNNKNKKKQKDAAPVSFSTVLIFLAKEYNSWQKEVLALLREHTDEKCVLTGDWKAVLKAKGLPADIQKKSLMFGTFTMKEAEEKGKGAFQESLPFSEEQLYRMVEESLLKETGCSEIKYVEVSAPGEYGSQKMFEQALGSTYPSKPQVLFE